MIKDTAAYEQLVFKYDPAHDDLNRAIVLVKKFITDNKLIIYGGTAIDYALRLCGDKIYPDDLFPDLDFYSPDNINHAYQLADILYNAGFAETRAINAAHMKTMKIDLGSNHFIADISFQPEVVFDIIPYLEYDHMRIVHPLFQRVDMHSALSFPYDGAPREVIFARWSKDVKRFNLLNKYYPVETQVSPPIPSMIPFERGPVFCGAVAYAFLYDRFSKWGVDDNDIIKARLDIKNMQVSANFIEIVSFDEQLGDKYEPLGTIMPAKTINESKNMIAYDTRNRLVSVNSIHVGDVSFRIVNVQYLLKHYIGLHFAGDIHALAYYNSIMRMIVHAEKHEPDPFVSPFFPSIQTYGNDNLDLTRLVLLSRIYHELDDSEPFSTPDNYYPSRSIPAGRAHPIFDIESSEFYREHGRAMTATNQK